MTEQCPECGCYVRITLKMPDGRRPRIRYCPYCGTGLRVVYRNYGFRVVRKDDEPSLPEMSEGAKKILDRLMEASGDE